ncbi:MAG: beta-ketoacyl reductase, partial [Chloroflexota bacterium]
LVAGQEDDDLAAALAAALQSKGGQVVAEEDAAQGAIVLCGDDWRTWLVPRLQRLLKTSSKLWLVTRHTQPVPGAAPANPASPPDPVSPTEPANLSQSGVWGLGAVIALEHPALWGGLIDIDDGRSADALAEFLLSSSREDRIALRGGRRFVPRLRPITTPPPAAAGNGVALRPDATYLVTGAFGGLGREVVRWMASKGARHLLLAGRTLPATTPEAPGVDVTAVRADVSDYDQLAAVIADARRRLPPIRGVVHAAGIVDDGVLEGLTGERLERVLAPKADAALHLHELTKALPLDFFVLFSSLASVCGAAGQANYAAANAVLDALAHHRTSLGLPAVSINWAPWREVGMAARLTDAGAQRVRLRGLDSLSTRSGLRCLEAAILSGLPQVVVLPARWPELRRAFGGALPPLLSSLEEAAGATARGAATPGTTVSSAGAQTPLAARLAAAHRGERAGLLAQEVSRLVAQALGWPADQRVPPTLALRDLGLDSLGALELRNALAAALGRRLPSTLLFDYPSVAAIAGFLNDELSDESDPAAPPTAGTDGTNGTDAAQLGTVLAELAALSDEDAREALTGTRS